MTNRAFVKQSKQTLRLFNKIRRKETRKRTKLLLRNARNVTVTFCHVGDDIEVMVLRVDSNERKIGLSRKRAEVPEEPEVEEEGASEAPVAPAKQPKDLKGGMGSEAGPLFKTPG